MSTLKSSREALADELSRLLYQHRQLQLHQIQAACPEVEFSGAWLEMYIGGPHECLTAASRNVLNGEMENIIALLEELGVLNL